GLRLLLWVAELGLVVVLSGMARRLSGSAAATLFFGYAALNGLSFSVLFVVYHLGSAAQAFLLTAGTFGAISVYGTVTRRDVGALQLYLDFVNLFLALLRLFGRRR